MIGSLNYNILPYAQDATSELVITSVKPGISPASLELPSSEQLLRNMNRINLYLLEMLNELGLLMTLNESNRIHISNRFNRLVENLTPLCNRVIANIELFLRMTGVSATKYVLDVYDLGEGGYSEVKPFVEVYINVEDVGKMLDVWENAINFLRIRLGDEVLDSIDVFFTRAR